MDLLVCIACLLFLAISSFAAETTQTPNSTGYLPLSSSTSGPQSRQHELCKDLEIGESLSVHWTKKQSPTEVPTSFTLKRASQNQWEVHMNIQFVENRKWGIDPVSIKTDDGLYWELQKANDLFNNKLKSCLSGGKGKFYDLNSNRSFVIKPSGSANYKKNKGPVGAVHPFETSVNIQPPVYNNGRSDMDNWVHGIDCETITHEVFHVLGLCDHYKEKNKIDLKKLGYKTAKGKVDAYNCRSIGSDNAIMSDQWEASKKGIRLTPCQCVDCSYRDYMDIKNEVRRLPKTLCPKPSQVAGKSKKLSGRGISEQAKALNFLHEHAKKHKGKKTTTTFLFPSAPDGVVVHSPTFNHILSPGCKSKNDLYYKCSRSAYKTKEIDGCPEVPSVCKQKGGIDNL